MKTFDRQFGKEFYLSLPASPGIYRFYNEANELIYVGKAKNLRRRLGQYRNAKRRKAHAKMRSVVAEARNLEYEVCESELQALQFENRWIQDFRPKWNVAGAFYFLYPMVGLRVHEGNLYLCYTTAPDDFPGYEFHGAFRSRQRTRDGFFALTDLLRLIGHPISRPQMEKSGNSSPSRKRGYTYGFRQVPEGWLARLDSFLSGEDFSAIEELSLLLLERPTAVSKRKDTQERLYEIRRFWRHEIQPLLRARKNSATSLYPVSQRDRDLLFIALRAVR